MSNGDEDRSGAEIAAGLVSCSEIRGDDQKDTWLLRKMAAHSKSYLEAFDWCRRVQECYFADGVGGIFAVFFFRIQANNSSVDEWIWVMWGDVPPAYLPLSDCISSQDAFRQYVRGMSKWADLALKSQTGSPEDGVPPVNHPSTPEWGDRLHQKLHALVAAVGPIFDPPEPSPLVH